MATVDAQFLAEVQMRLESAGFMAEAKRAFNMALQDTTRFEQRVNAVLKRMSRKGVDFFFDFDDVQGSLQLLKRHIDEIRAEAQAAGEKFNFKGALQDWKEISRLVQLAETASVRMAAATESMAPELLHQQELRERRATGTPMGELAGGSELSTAQKQLLFLESRIRSLSDIPINLDIQDLGLDDLKRVETAVELIKDQIKAAGQSKGPVNIFELERALAIASKMNTKIRDMMASTDLTEDQVKELGDEWARVQRMIDAAQRKAQQNIMKTTVATQGLIRVVQDAPFGWMGMTNNIQVLSEEFGRLRQQGMRVGDAMKGMFAGLIRGPMAIPAALTLLTTVILLLDRYPGVLNRIGEGFGLVSFKAHATAKEVDKAFKESFSAVIEGIDSLERLESVVRVSSMSVEDLKDELEDTTGIKATFGWFNRASIAIREFEGTMTEAQATQARQILSDIEHGRTAATLARTLIEVAEAQHKAAVSAREAGASWDEARLALTNLNAVSDQWLSTVNAIDRDFELVGLRGAARAEAQARQQGQARLQQLEDQYRDEAQALDRQLAVSSASIRERQRLGEELNANELELHRQMVNERMALDLDYNERRQRQEQITADNIALTHERSTSRSANTAERFSDRLREYGERLRQEQDRAAMLLMPEGYARQLEQFRLAEQKRVDMLSEIYDFTQDNSGRAGIAELIRLYNEFLATSNRLADVEKGRMLVVNEMTLAQRELALASARANNLEIETQTNYTEFTLNSVREAQNELLLAQDMLAVTRARINAEIAESMRRINVLEANIDALGEDQRHELEMERERLEGLRLRENQNEITTQNRLAEARFNVVMAMREEIRAIHDRNRAAREFRQESEDMISNPREDPRVRAAIEARNAMREENNRWLMEQREFEDEIARLQVDAAKDPKIQGMLDGAMAARENAQKNHYERLKDLAVVHAREMEAIEAERRREMMNASIGLLGSLASASESLYDTWRTVRERQLEAEGVGEEERNAILLREGHRRFQTMKKLKIAEAIAHTISAGVAAYETGVKIGGPAGLIVGGAMMAAALATGYAQVRALQALQPDGSGGSGTSNVAGGAFTSLNGTITGDRVAQFEQGSNPLRPGSDGFRSITARFEEAIQRFEESAANLTATTTPATAEANFHVARRRAIDLNQ